MTPIDYMLLPLRRYAQFEGRADRPEYWWFVVFQFLVQAVAFIGGMLPFVGVAFVVAGVLATFGFFIPSLAVGFRRLHDTDRSAWWILIGLIPLLGWIVLIVFACQRGAQGPNRFGDDPKAPLDKVVETF